jgi:hypothetical protein
MSKLGISPTLNWSLFIASLFRGSNKGSQQINKIWCGDKDKAHWLSKSAWSLNAIIKWWEKVYEQEAPNFWLPDYFCNQSLDLVRRTDAKLIFYPIDENLIPDWDKCRELAILSPPDIFLMVHYFGKEADGKGAKKFCHKNRSLFVEDATHVLAPNGGIGSFGDFVCYSPHKQLSLPDGALLVQRPLSKPLKQLLKADPQKSMDIIIGSLPHTAPSPWIWLAKRLIQRALPFYFIKRLVTKKSPAYTVDVVTKPTKDLPHQSSLSRHLLQVQIKKIPQFKIQRQENFAVVNSLVDQISDNFSLLNESDSKLLPYLGVVQGRSQDIANDAFQKLAQKGYPVQSWPDLPGEVLDNSEEHTQAIYFRRTLLAFPIHQGLGIHGADQLCRLYKQTLKDSEEKSKVQLVRFTGDFNLWDQLLSQVGKSNLLQSWAYGEAKVKAEGWSIHRVVFEKEGKTIAFAQILEKQKGPVHISRINRGPLFLDQANFSTIREVYHCLRKQFSLLKGRILLIAPELEKKPTNSALFKLLPYIKRPSSKWCSAWVNLHLSESTLRKNLNSKWRNMLNVLEKDKNLSLKLDVTEEGFHWLMGNYAEMMAKKNFQGTPIPLLVQLRNQIKKKEDFLICRAINLEGKSVAGILLIRHGDAVTYSVGWNSAEGRKLKANNFLLWNAILEMKRRGCSWFDLGGIDKIGTPEISRFKQGINGDEYISMGEWVNL